MHLQMMELCLASQKLRKLHTEVAKFLGTEAFPTAREVPCLLKKLNSVSQAILPGPLLQDDTKRPGKGTGQGESIILNTFPFVSYGQG